MKEHQPIATINTGKLLTREENLNEKQKKKQIDKRKFRKRMMIIWKEKFSFKTNEKTFIKKTNNFFNNTHNTTTIITTLR